MTEFKSKTLFHFQKQNGFCFYCKQPMWLGSSEEYRRTYCITKKQARHRQATAEHLTPKSDGGSNSIANLVAACRFCNSHRHRSCKLKSPDEYAKYVTSRLARGKWHVAKLHFPQS